MSLSLSLCPTLIDISYTNIKRNQRNDLVVVIAAITRPTTDTMPQRVGSPLDAPVSHVLRTKTATRQLAHAI